MSARAFAVLAALLALFVARAAEAAPQLRTTVSPSTVEVGGMAVVTLAVTPGDKVSQADLRSVPSGLTLVGQSVSPSFQITVVNGQMSQIVTARATFTLRTSREGTYVVGPPAVVVDGARLVGGQVTLKVVARGTLPRRQPNPFDPFDLFGQGGQSPFAGMQPLDQMPDDAFTPTYPVDPRFSLDHALAPGTFLHATTDTSNVVVGQQVTLSVYLYFDVTQPDPQLSDPHEVGTSDFLRQSLLKDDAPIERSGYARVGGRVYGVALLRKYALFPLHAGALSITPMRLTVGRGERASETLTVHVTEPPIDHRPPGYVLGDTGHFTLTAEVAPREVQRGAAVAVNVDVSGSGNLPTKLTVPARPGVTWLEPDVKDDMHVLDPSVAGASGVWGGTRHFAYIVTPTREGDLDLGEIAASYYDPRARAYGIARATLGIVHVTPGAAPISSEGERPLAHLPPLRAQMGSTRVAEPHLDDSSAFFALLVMPTALFGFAVTGRRAARRLAERVSERKTSPMAELKQRLRALDAAEAGDDARALDGATISTLESAAMAHAGVNVRGVGGEEVASVLTRAGVSAETAGQLRDLLDACAAGRFSPDGAALVDARKRSTRAKSIVEQLAAAPPSSDPTSGRRDA